MESKPSGRLCRWGVRRPEIGDWYSVSSTASCLEGHSTIHDRQKFPGRVVYVHPAGRFAVLEFSDNGRGYRESYFPEDLEGSRI